MHVMNWRFLMVFGCMMLVLSGCDNADKKNAAANPSKIVMITSGDNPPYEFLKIENGESVLVGFDMEMVDQLAQIMGTPIEKVNADFNAIIPSLLSGRADFSAAGITVTEERKKSVDFSKPYLVTRVAVLYKKSEEALDSKNLKGKTLGVSIGTVHEAVIKKIIGDESSSKIVYFNQIPELVQELKSGRLDGVVIDYMPAKYFVEQNPELAYNYLEGGDVEFSLAFPKSSPWVEKFNVAIEQWMKSPSYEALQKKWFKDQ
jgi:ABC-type amino acid transport substrate-binding protein